MFDFFLNLKFGHCYLHLHAILCHSTLQPFMFWICHSIVREISVFIYVLVSVMQYPSSIPSVCSTGSCVCMQRAGLSAIRHHLTDSSIWYTDSICRALRVTTLITCTDAPAHSHTCLCVYTHVIVFTLLSLKPQSRSFCPLRPILSSIGCPPCFRQGALEN